MRTVLTLALLVLTSLPVLAEDARVSLPLPRPDSEANDAAGPVAPEPDLVMPLPRQRPAAVPETPAVDADVPEDAADAPPAEAVAPVAEPGPPRPYQTACPALLDGQVEATALPPITENLCRVRSPLALTGVLANGRMLPISGGVVTDCGMATVLPEWVASVDSYLLASTGSRLAEVLGGTSYMCRNVNNGAAGRLSFHAFGTALDVSGFRLEDGRTVTVEAGWADALSADGRLLRFAHDAACSRFTTVLGPEANALHHDHLHLDLGCHGRTCTARLCE